MSWDAFHNRWAFAVDVSGTRKVVFVYDAGCAAFSVAANGTDPSVTGFLVGLFSAADGETYAFESVNGAIWKYADVAGTWSSAIVISGIFVDNVDVAFTGTNYIAGGATLGGDPCEIYTAAPGSLMSAWTKRSVPANVAAGNRVALVVGAAPAVSSRVLLVQRRAAAAGVATYATSDDHGISWTSRLFSGGVYNTATDKIQTVAYDSTSELFVMVATTSTTSTKVFTSPDAITWTLASTIAATAPQGIASGGLACVGPLWIMTCERVSDNVDGTFALASIDLGATWSKLETLLGSDSTTKTDAEYFRPNLFSNGTRICFANGKYFRFSTSTVGA